MKLIDVLVGKESDFDHVIGNSSAGLRPERLRPNGAPNIFQFFLCNNSVSSFFERKFVCAGNCLFLLPDG
jgi:hypothetical protein